MSGRKHFFIYRIDKPGVAERREKTRPAHLDYAATLGDTLVFAGPTLTDDGSGMDGSVWVLAVDTAEEADAITRADPYEQVDLFRSKTIKPLMKVIPAD